MHMHPLPWYTHAHAHAHTHTHTHTHKDKEHVTTSTTNDMPIVNICTYMCEQVQGHMHVQASMRPHTCASRHEATCVPGHMHIGTAHSLQT